MYYYGKGERRIGPNPFEQVEFDSDRAAGIVAGSIVETRLEQALKSRLIDDSKIVMNLFRPSGPLGPFSVKISLSYLLGLLSAEAHIDLITIKDIRNAFAHKLDIDSFDVPTVRDRCKNLRVIHRHIGPLSDTPLDQPPTETGKGSFYMQLPDYEAKINDPRYLYTMTAQMISNHLGEAADRPETEPPFV